PRPALFPSQLPRPCSWRGGRATAAIGSTKACSRRAAPRRQAGGASPQNSGPGPASADAPPSTGGRAPPPAPPLAAPRRTCRAAFEAFAQSTPELYHHMTALLAQRLRDTNHALLATNFLSVKGRVARALLNLTEAFGHDLGQGRILIRQKVSQSDLAAMAGIA